MTLELHLTGGERDDTDAIADFCEEAGWRVNRYASVGDLLADGAGGEASLLLVSIAEGWNEPYRASVVELLSNWHEAHPGMQLVLFLPRSIEEADRLAIDIGARHTLIRPWRPADLSRILSQVAAGVGERRRREAIRRRNEESRGFEGIIGESRAISRVLDLARRVAGSEYTSVMITGESGTGKGAIARAIHESSPRAGGPFIEVNCAAIPTSLLESEFFGHEQGAFTDAKDRKIGLFECANGGTIFLDEVGEIEYGLQAKLLKFLDTRTIRRVSGTTFLPVDVRVLAATNRDLREDVAGGRFRADLFYRLNVVEIAMPPLRDRREDIRPIAEDYTQRIASRLRGKKAVLTPEANDLLEKYRWPGNVRELINVIERAVLLSADGSITPADLPIEAEESETGIRVEERQGRIRIDLPPGGTSLEEIERAAILAAIERTGGNITRAAGLLRVSRGTLRYKMKKYDIDGAGIKKKIKTGEYEPVLSN
ncbi:MAG: sigma-54-dependent Fis family transcriptional regulator [Candidatus Krumholzibacteriota bacterium]|nr:sigma-54-dependent Fis family transcriptional regulator [Candidatus Krumholzibacteriota bacterium]